MESPKITVIMPIYNVEDYLEDTLDNIVNQTFIDNIEVIMIDDGSTDNSRYIIEKYALDYNNFYAFHKKNEGQCVARNFALLLARGEYIHFMDSDDFITHDAYEKLYKFANNGNYDVVTFNYLRFDENKTWKVASQIDVFDETSGNIENTNLYDFKELSWDMTNCNKLVKKELLDKHNIKYYYKNIIYEDNLFWINVYSKAEKMAVLKDYIYFWRYRENLTSTTQNRDLDLAERIYEMAYLVNNFITQNIKDEKILNKKYEKLLTINLFFLIRDIRGYPKEEHELLFEGVYKIIDLVPNVYFENLNSYFQVIYDMVKNKDLDVLFRFLSYDFKKNPKLPDNIDSNYITKLDFKKDSYSENLNSTANSILINNNELIIEFKNFVPFNFEDNIEKTSFKLLNEKFEPVLLDYRFIKNNELHIPLDLINNGEHNIFTTVYYDNIKKESFMKVYSDKTFIFEDYDIYIKCGPANMFRLIKRAKNDMNVSINQVNIIDDKLYFEGFSNKKITNISINDYLNISKFNYPINFISKEEFNFNINLIDLIKAPIRKWELVSDEIFNKINLSKEYKFYNNRYVLSIKNQANTVIIELDFYSPLNQITSLTNENEQLTKFNNVLKSINNQLTELLPQPYDFGEQYKYDKGRLSEHNDIWSVSSEGKLKRLPDYTELLNINKNGAFFIGTTISSSNTIIEYDIFQFDGILNDYHVNFRNMNNVYLNGFSIKELGLSIGEWHHITITILDNKFNVSNDTNTRTINSRKLNASEKNIIFQLKPDGDNSILRFKNFIMYKF